VLNEAMILSTTSHPNIIKLLGKYRSKQYYNLILEYCNEGDLKNYLKTHGVFKEHEAKHIIS